MILRTAKQGPNAGNQFYGCTSFPTCRGTVSLNTDSGRNVEESEDEPLDVFVPRRMIAEPAQVSVQTRYYQSAGYPNALVTTAYTDNIDSETRSTLIRAASQWRLDYPVSPVATVAQEVRTLLSVAESILTRGSLTLCSPGMEDRLLSAYGHDTWHVGVIDSLKLFSTVDTAPLAFDNFDSQEESLFVDWFHGQNSVSASPWRLTPQVHIHSLDPKSEVLAGARVDFLLTRPFATPIVVEIDGEQHKDHSQVDQARDELLRRQGYDLVRIPAGAMRSKTSQPLAKLAALLGVGSSRPAAKSMQLLPFEVARFVHQVEVVTIEALRSGRLRLGERQTIYLAPPKTIMDDPVALNIVAHAPNDALELINGIAEVYGVVLPDTNIDVRIAIPEVTAADVTIVSSDDAISSRQHLRTLANSYTISNTYFPFDIAMPTQVDPPTRLALPSKNGATKLLHYIFRKQSFRDGQWEAVERCLQGKDSVVLLPTGAGKSIAFQLAALLLPGPCLVIDPIIALIDDQIDNLRITGIDRCAGITSASGASKDTQQEGFARGWYLFCFVAPERLQMQPFRDALGTLTASGVPISLIAVDEAHCVSEWGHDFRTSYLNLGRIARRHGSSGNIVPPLIALTGTASRIVLKDVQRELQIDDFDAIIAPQSFDRKNLQFEVITTPSHSKDSAVTGFIGGLPSRFGVSETYFASDRTDKGFAGLVFCPHVGGQYGVIQLAERISKQHPAAAVGYYAGSPPKNWKDQDWNKRKSETARRFKRNQLNLLASTSAFGMGIDKPNIRYTVHLGLPDSIEEFYQEAGRAGRGGESDTSFCSIILSDDDPKRSSRLLDPSTSIDEVRRAVKGTSYSDNDDVMRTLFFHARAFRGQENDKRDIHIILDMLGNVTSRSTRALNWRSEPISRERMEKALHRLVVIGIIEDYTVNYASQEFLVRLSGATQPEIAEALGAYAGTYQTALAETTRRRALALQSFDNKAFVAGVSDLLVDFVYEHIELARRRSLSEMLNAARSATDGEKLRERILRYLEATEFDERLGEIMESSAGGLDILDQVLMDVVSPKEAESLRGAVAQYLSSYPDVPGLLLLRACSEALSRDGSEEVVRENIMAAIGYALDQYHFAPEAVGRQCGGTVERLKAKEGTAELFLRYFVTAPNADRDFVRGLLQTVPAEYATIPAQWLSIRMAQQTETLLQKGMSKNGYTTAS